MQFYKKFELSSEFDKLIEKVEKVLCEPH